MRARWLRANQLPSGSRRLAGTACSRIGESIGRRCLLGRDGEVAGVDGHVDVGLGVLALGGDALSQLGIGAFEELDVDAEFVFGER